MTVPANIDALLLGGERGYRIERSLRFNSADSAYLNRTPASAGNRRTFTWSFWIKRAAALAANQRIFDVYNAGTGFTDTLYFGTGDAMSFWLADASQGVFTTSQVFRDCSAWYHIVLAIDTTQGTSTNRIKLYVNGSQVTAFSSITYPSQNYDCYINNTVAHNIGRAVPTANQYLNGYLTEINFIDGQALTASSFGETDTITGVWKPKKYSGSGYGTNGFYLNFSKNVLSTDLTSTATLTAPFGGTAENARTANSVYLTSNTSTGSTFTFLQEDFGSVVPLSRFFIGAMSFSGGVSTFELQYSTNGSTWTTGSTLSITATGQNISGNINVLARYVRLQATAFGTNGQASIDCLVVYQDELGYDSSGNNNNWVPNNFSVTAGAGNDSLIDTPTPYADGGNGRGNYCTLNPITTARTPKPSNGNLYQAAGVVGDNIFVVGTLGVSSGKWYWELTADSTYAQAGFATGLHSPTFNGSATSSSSFAYAYYGANGQKYNNGTNSAYGNTFTANDVIGVALDMDNGKLWFAKNNTWQASGDPVAGTNAAFTGLSGTLLPCIGAPDQYGVGNVNFGQRPFAYTPPSGFVALNTQNLPEPSIKKPNQYFDATIYTGDGTDPRPLTNSGLMQPDLVWIKARGSSTLSDHVLDDSVRGATNDLFANLTAAEQANNSVRSFNSNGFSVGNSTRVNQSSIAYVGWQWKESATPGFDIVTYTGDGVNTRTISHNLGVTPAFFITKNRDGYNNSQGFNDWNVYHQNLPVYNTTGSQALYLMSTTNAGAAGGFFTRPTSTVFTPNQTAYDNVSSRTYVAYLWSEVAGFSKFGSYTGNGSTDGPFVFCGFRPRWIMVKATAGAENWVMLDSARNTYNVANDRIYANSANVLSAADLVDFTASGFKVRNSGTNDLNTSSRTYIFAAFAEAPFKYALAR